MPLDSRQKIITLRDGRLQELAAAKARKEALRLAERAKTGEPWPVDTAICQSCSHHLHPPLMLPNNCSDCSKYSDLKSQPYSRRRSERKGTCQRERVCVLLCILNDEYQQFVRKRELFVAWNCVLWTVLAQLRRAKGGSPDFKSC